jgi:hypothetical protein
MSNLAPTLEHTFLKLYPSRDGPDGPWASFNINVGNYDAMYAGQTFRAFPGVSLSIVLLPLAADFCSGIRLSDPSCVARNVFQTNASRSFNSDGEIDIISALGLSSLVSDNHTAEAKPYGEDCVGLGSVGPESLILAGTTVAGVVSRDFLMTLFGLSNAAFNLGKGKTRTFLTNFRKTALIPSTSFSYTAGSYGRRDSPPSLVLGGYDTTRFDPSTTLQVDIRDTTEVSDPYQLAVNITAITLTRSPGKKVNGDMSTMLNPNKSGMTVNVDPVTAQIWLPIFICEEFERVFGIEWDYTRKLYLVNASRHDWLVQMNHSVTFSLSSSRSNDAIKNFTLPYSAFDLNVTYPLVETGSYYFPLKRASDDGPFTLGRTFLQETHISVDYDYGYFNISQANPGTNEANIVPVLPLYTEPTKPTQTTGLSTGAYAGIGIGAGVVAVVIGLLLFRWKEWRPFKSQDSGGEDEVRYNKPELHGAAVPGVLRVEAMEGERAELETKERSHEVTGTEVNLPGIARLNSLHEMDAGGSS